MNPQIGFMVNQEYKRQEPGYIIPYTYYYVCIRITKNRSIYVFDDFFMNILKFSICIYK